MLLLSKGVRLLALLWLVGGTAAAVWRFHRYRPIVLAGTIVVVLALAGGLWAISFFIRLAAEDEEE